MVLLVSSIGIWDLDSWILVFTALSFLLFSRENVDIAIVEAGLGGARDATNVIRNTELAASVITTIGKEHLAALGGSLQSIAVAKSGIIEEGRPIRFLLRSLMKVNGLVSCSIEKCPPLSLAFPNRLRPQSFSPNITADQLATDIAHRLECVQLMMQRLQYNVFMLSYRGSSMVRFEEEK